MAAKAEIDSYQRFWIVASDAATAERLLELAESPPSLENHPPNSITIKFGGSGAGIQLEGAPEEVRQEFDQLLDKEFVNGALTVSYPFGNNPKFTVSFNFGTRAFNATLNPGTGELAEQLFNELRSRFPSERGPSTPELEKQGARLRNLIQEAEKLQKSSADIKQMRDRVNKISDRITEFEKQANSQVTHIKEVASLATQALTETQTKRDEATKGLTETLQAKDEASKNLVAIQESQNNVGALEAKVRQFHSEIAENQKKMGELQTRSSQIIDENKDKTEQITAENARLQDEIREQLLKAAGGALFGSFEERKGQILKTKWRWAIATVIAFLFQVGAVLWLTYEAKSIPSGDGAFYSQPIFILKAIVNVPIMGLIWFCIHQYNNEREIEEVYAFKSALSFSLAPYLDLVKAMPETETDNEHRTFAIRTIGQIFENPLTEGGAQKKHSRKEGMLFRDLIKEFTELAKILKL